MSQDISFSRHDILSLDLKTIKDCICPGKHTELAVSENGIDIASFDPSVQSWVLSIPNNISITRNKIGKTLLKQHQNGFILHDPHMYQSRFCVEYHRMQDPALKRYFKSAPVRQRLENLGVITKEDNVLCSKKEFAEYLRYLESLHALEIAEGIKNSRQKRVTDNLQKLVDTQKYESQFTGIFRRKKLQRQQKPKATLTEDRKTSSKQSNLNVSKANERSERIKEEKRNHFKQKNKDKDDKSNMTKQMMLQMAYKRKLEADKKFKSKLEKAQQLKRHLQDEKVINKLTDGVKFFKKHWAFREETRHRNIRLYQMYEEEKRRNMEKRIKQIEQIREKDDAKKIKLRRDIARKGICKEIIEKVTKQSQKLSEKYLKTVNQKDFEEISRRFSMLTEPFITDCLQKITVVLKNLKISVSGATLVEKLFSIMTQCVIIVPEIGPTTCVLVRERVAGLISHIIIQIKNDRLKCIRDHWIKKKQAVESDISTADENASVSKHVSMDDAEYIIGESSFSFDEFIGDLKSASKREIEKTYDLKKIINIYIKTFFETISKTEFHFSEKLNDRDFVHLYDFQKFFIHRTIRRIIELVKDKQLHYWNVKRKIATWQKLNLNLDDLSFAFIDLIMIFPCQSKDICAVVRNISKYICVQLSQELDKEQIYEYDHSSEKSGDDHSSEYESDSDD